MYFLESNLAHMAPLSEYQCNIVKHDSTEEALKYHKMPYIQLFFLQFRPAQIIPPTMHAFILILTNIDL
jgi:hypothetical protein